MADLQPGVIAKIEDGKVVAQAAQPAGDPAADAAAAAVAEGEAAIASGSQVALNAAQASLAAAAPTSTAAAAVAGNVNAALQQAAATQAIQATQPLTSNTPDLINAAVQGGIITADQAAKMNDMAASQTVTAPPAEAAPSAPVIAGANIPAPAGTYADQIAGEVKPKIGTRGAA